MFVIKPFNLTFFGLITLIIALIVSLTLIFKNKSEKAKKIVVLTISIFNIILWILYKVWLYIGVPEYNAIGYSFNIFAELPLQACNISLFLIVIGIIFNKEALYAYCIYMAVIGAIMSIFTPMQGFYDNSIFLRHNIGYYGTHSLIIVDGVLLITLGLFKPNYKAFIKMVVLLPIMAICAHLINLLFLYAFNQQTDYFFTMHMYEDSALSWFYSIIPVRLIYLVIPYLLFSLFLLLITFLFEIYYKSKKRRIDAKN